MVLRLLKKTERYMNFEVLFSHDGAVLVLGVILKQ